MKVKLLSAACACALAFALLAGCGGESASTPKCTVIFEDNPAVTIVKNTYQIRKNSNLTVSIRVPADMVVTGVNYANSSLVKSSQGSASYNYYQLTLYSVGYSSLIRLTVERQLTLTYAWGNDSFEEELSGIHLRANTAAWSGQFERAGYVATGWNTREDGSGTHAGFGSRMALSGDATLYPDWAKCSDEQFFDWRKEGGGAYITAYDGQGDLVIPRTLGGLPVKGIDGGSFGHITASVVVFPDTLETISDGAFAYLDCDELYLFDNIETLSEDSFGGYSIGRLHINAVLPPVYSTNYFATFADKVDWLDSIAKERKIVFFSGSSARFGYDSTAFAEAFPEYNVANMGVFAYSNMRPQAEIVGACLGEGDIVISSPELDAIDTQFCGNPALDSWTYCLMEANYDMLSSADMRGYTDIFGAFAEYNAVRRTMQPTDYDDSPSFYTEKGEKYDGISYNKYGDYTVFRENNESSKPLSGTKKAYFNPDHITERDWAGLNGVYDMFAAKGAKVYFSYSVRSVLGLSDDTTEESIAALEKEVRTRLHAEVLDDAHGAIMQPEYFYDTDNHLSSEGVKLHTARIIALLKAARKE